MMIAPRPRGHSRGTRFTQGTLIWDQEYWDHRAEVASTIGESIRHPECKRIMAEIAESYARLARLTRAFQNAAGTPVTIDHLAKMEMVLKH
jgi:hypothetical protein